MTAAVPWPVTKRMEAAGFTDTFRAAHPDPVARTGLTYSPGFPWPVQRDDESLDRIDYVFAANATIRGAEVWGEPGNPDVDKGFDPWPSDHRAVIADLTVAPVDAPRLARRRAAPRARDRHLCRPWLPSRRRGLGCRIVPRGGDPATQTVTSVEGLTPTWNRAFRFSTLGLRPGPWDAVLIDEAGAEQARTRFSVLTRDGKPTLPSPRPPQNRRPAHCQLDRRPRLQVRLDRRLCRGRPNLYNYLAFAYTGATLDGTMTLTPDLYYQVLDPGDYELRLMSDDHYVTLATAPFTITD